MLRLLPLFALLGPTGVRAHEGPHLHPHGAEFPVLALLGLAAAAAVLLLLRTRR
jgi:hypothetical protein